MKVIEFSSIWTLVLRVYDASGKSYLYRDNKSIYFGKEQPVNPGEKISLREHIEELVGKTISGSTLYQNYHNVVIKYLNGEEEDTSIDPQKLDILQTYIQKGIELYDLKIPQYLVKEKTRTQRPVSAKLNLFANTHWYIYQYDEYKIMERTFGQRQRVTRIWGISQSVLRIDEHLGAEIETDKRTSPEEIRNSDYTGIVSLDENAILELVFKTKKTDENKLHIKTIINRGSLFPLSLGSYLSADHEGYLKAGTVVMEQLRDDQITNAEPKFYQGNSKEYMELDTYIRDYLKDKQYNYIKIPTGISAKPDLFEWLSNKQKERLKQPDKYQNYLYDVFIAAPGSTLTMDQFKELNDVVKKIEKTLQEHRYLDRVFHNSLQYDDQRLIWEQSEVLKNQVLSNIESSRYFMLIYPERVVSSSLVETGWALGSYKPTIIFHRKGNELPSILKKHNLIQNMVSIKVIEFVDYNDIITCVKTQHDLFDWS